MVTKKQKIMLGLVAIGGLALASQVAAPEGGVPQPRFGRILGTPGAEAIAPAAPLAPTVYQIPAAGEVTFPAAPTFDISAFLAPLTKVKKVAEKNDTKKDIIEMQALRREKFGAVPGSGVVPYAWSGYTPPEYGPRAWEAPAGGAAAISLVGAKVVSEPKPITKKEAPKPKKIRRISAFTPSQKARVARHMAKVT